MKEQLYTNNTAQTQFVGGKLIPPFESRTVMTRDIGTIKPTMDVNSILARPVKELEAEIELKTLDELQVLLAAETSNANRKGAVDLIEKLIPSREYDMDLQEFALSLSDVEDIEALLLLVGDDENKVAMVEEEIARREEQLKDDNQ